MNGRTVALIAGATLVAGVVIGRCSFRGSRGPDAESGACGINGSTGAVAVASTDVSGAKAVRKPRHAEGVSRNAEIAALRAELQEAMKEKLEDRKIEELLDEIRDLLLDEDFSKTERKFVRGLREALEDNDAERVRSRARVARRSANPEIRKTAVAALGWFGDEAEKELRLFLDDADPEVAEEALNQWELAIQQFENESDMLAALKEFLLKCSDEGSCDYLSIHLIAASDQTMSVRTIIDLMASPNEACKESAKEAYEWITDSAWKDSATAEAWIAKSKSEQE